YAYSSRGGLAYEELKYTSALGDLDKAIELDPTNRYAYLYRAELKNATGNMEGALLDYRKLYIFEPTNNDWGFMLSKALIDSKKYEEALYIFNKIIAANSKNGKYLVQQAVAMSGLGNTTRAVAQFQRVITNDSTIIDKLNTAQKNKETAGNVIPILSAAYICMGDTYVPPKDNDTSIIYQKADRAIGILKTIISDAYIGIVTTNLMHNDTAAAYRNISRAIETDQDNDNAYFAMANLKMVKKNYLGADYDYVSVLLINPRNIKTYAYRGLAESYIPDTAGMRTDFERAIKLSPQNENNYILRGEAKINLKDLARAIKDFDTAIALNPKNPDGWFYRGLAKINQNNRSGCSDLTKALELGSKEAAGAIKKYCGH
ncbi:MAG TPA: tetratricopeptide repeat protein, partial [Mucilaginibacter sp.]